jgi:sialic acid synthase SpsE
MKKGEVFTEDNLRSIRPSNGLSPKYFWSILGKKSTGAIKKGTPLRWGKTEKRGRRKRSRKDG